MGDGVSSGPNPFVWTASRGTVWCPARVQRELDYLRTQPFFRPANQSVQQGRLQVEGKLAYTLLETGRIQSLAIRMEYPTEYPWDVPKIFDCENHFQPSAKGHQFPDHRLCLSFPPRSEFTLGSESLSGEVLGASLIWLDKRFIFERTAEWPGEAEEHGWARPLRQLLIEEANRSAAPSLKAWTDWVVEELVTPNYDGGCPCCSGKAFRLCHRKLAMLVFLYRFSAQEERELHGRGTALEAA